MSRRFRLTPRAYADLRAIADYTDRIWGADQRARYLRDIDARFHWLAEQPEAGKPRPDIAEDYRCFRQGEHLIFYLISGDMIDIIGVPHQAMDVANYFDD